MRERRGQVHPFGEEFFLFFRSTSFSLYREEDRVEDEGLENQKPWLFSF